MRRPWPALGRSATGKRNVTYIGPPNYGSSPFTQSEENTVDRWWFEKRTLSRIVGHKRAK